MAYNIGEFRESLVVSNLDGRKFEDLSLNLQNMVKFIFPNCKKDDIVHSNRIEEIMKPDFTITINGETHYVSMKSGGNNIIHQESIKSFIETLRKYGITDHSLRTILFFQYGDGTLDGSGKERMSYPTLRKKIEKASIIANADLNYNRKMMIELVDRFMFKGAKEGNITAEFLYHGDLNQGFIISREQVLKHLEYKNWDYIESLHIGPVLFRPHARYYKTAIRKESSRSKVEFYWPNLISDMMYMSSHYLP